MKIVVLDGYTENPGDLSWEGLEKFGELTVYDRTSYTDSPLIAERIGDAEIAIINKTPITKATIDACPNLKCIAVLATGYNVVDVARAREKGIPVSNVPAYGTQAVAQFALQVSHEVAGAVAVVCLGHHVLWHETILRHQVCHACVCASVAQRVLKQPRHNLVVKRLFARVDDALQEKIAFLQLVVEEEINLAKEEILHAKRLHGTIAQHICSCEEPAASALLLVADAGALNFYAEMRVRRLCVLLIQCNRLDAAAAYGVA